MRRSAALDRFDCRGFLSSLREKFWEKFSLTELTPKEWDALCDGCGLCCLLRNIDSDAEGDFVVVYGVACELLDLSTARCGDYPNRARRIPGCRRLTPENVPFYDWLPQTCAYRLIHQRKPLPEWHPLLAGNRDLMRSLGKVVPPTTLSEKQVTAWQLRKYIIDSWPISDETMT